MHRPSRAFEPPQDEWSWLVEQRGQDAEAAGAVGITWAAASARKFEGVELTTEGAMTAERARLLVEAMLRTGLAAS